MRPDRSIKNLYISRRWYILVACCIVFFVVSFFLPGLFAAAAVFAGFAGVLTLLDLLLLFRSRGTIRGQRKMTERFSLGDENQVALQCDNYFPFPVRALIIEQLPEQFQVRNFSRETRIDQKGTVKISYRLRPTTRGTYEFGSLLVYVGTPVGLLQLRQSVSPPRQIKVYPSYLQLKKYNLMASTEVVPTGVRKIRRLGHSLEFEKIKDYVSGDDIRTMNWKATARAGQLMVNTYTDARQQQVYAIIDKGRTMKMPFEGMTLLDYAINASLTLLNVVLLKQDKAGLLSFSNEIGDIVPAETRRGQLHRLMEALYQQSTSFKESDYELLYYTLHQRISQRSFLLLFTNFETLAALERQLPYLKKLASRHLMCVVFFQNTLLKDIREGHPDSTEGIYIKTISERFDFEKKLIVKELRRHGILAVLTTPQHLTIDVINKYLELKARQMV